ncbi:MAG: hypothetical protein WDN49_08795 [Acetobacteraceae bacterium]
MRPVFPIPKHQTKSGFRSRSTLHGTAAEFNELSFDDLREKELVYLHAQKDYTIKVEHDEQVTVGRNITVTAETGKIDISAAISITLRVGGNSIVIDQDGIRITSTLQVAITAGADVNVLAAGLVSAEAGGDVNLTGGGAVTIEAGGDVNIAAVGAVSIEAAEFVAVPPPDLPV